MRRDQNIGIDPFEGVDCLGDVFVAERWYDVETADDGVYFVDAGDFLGLRDRIDNAAMAARSQHDEALAFDQIGGRDFVVKIVGI